MLSLLGHRVPVALQIFLAALAIIDDLGAIVVIALFYVHDFSLLYLVLALGIFVGLLILNRLQTMPTAPTHQGRPGPHADRSPPFVYLSCRHRP